ncbi:DUF1707 SHOCT-like domain-containing protein [Embleya sp. AB8]|uniref:DUF1707 SHOCT-like domain-containing protein n=1 Tax=Embleya sp. AB8 TaxID=3156304 RepID=UPI003C7309DF
MDNSPERRSQPAVPELRASDADRDRCVNILRDALAEGRLTAEEHEERLDAALAAKTHSQLEPLVADLPVPGVGPIVYRPAPDSVTVPDRPARSNMFAFWSSSTRKGRWRTGEKLNAVAVMGGVDIDLTEAVFDGPELVINVFAFWGGVDIRIPEGVTVRDHGIGIMGAFDVREQYTDDPHAPVVVIKGVAVMGGVSVRVKRRKDQHKRAIDDDFRRELGPDRFGPDRFRKDPG